MSEEKKPVAIVEEKKAKKIRLSRDDQLPEHSADAQKLEADGNESMFNRAADMKPCPIGAESACCKHCFMGPCRLNSRDPYAKVGVCGATIDTIAARNFARNVAAGGAAHTDHGMGMLDVFREVVNGRVSHFKIQDETKLKNVAESIGIATEGRPVKDIAMGPL